MGGKLKRLSGQEVIAILGRFGFQPVHQRGSHVKLRRINPAGMKQTLTVIVHDELDVGTLRSIFRQASRFIPEDELRPYFYSE
ncbi:MAG: type II toxin-antitoxin system HicA family toxin [Candidatus Bipolaricaulota bacterium]|nr:type II toxin-antitoxin system HicA family toxin [Candidatus Bipolaricaulota bacterium]MCS7274903.1 type II toxin-antitoxin system HicA family toxin [Candidatus Bipolaricaulota bacterium]MDW8110492.1 type II toxin-antitoxin system HicA family toxin [Candidatus Bipolaricaulota bacterium]MDW8329173.1 type II toxin-antitoxin system HicA family toxin [Candidatus Bipolaricaulota bacterium]